jgi:hypothetical protein
MHNGESLTSKECHASIISSEELSEEIKKWHNIRDLVINNDIRPSHWVFKSFHKETLDLIKHDLEINSKNQQSQVEWCAIIRKIIMEFNKPTQPSQPTTVASSNQPQSNFVKTAEFDKPLHAIYLGFERVDMGTVNSKFGDKYGKVNKLTYQDKSDNKQKIYISTSFSFLKAFKDADLKSGDEVVIVSVGFKDPTADGINYRHWIVQKLSGRPSEKEVRANEGGVTVAPAVNKEVTATPKVEEDQFDW